MRSIVPCFNSANNANSSPDSYWIPCDTLPLNQSLNGRFLAGEYPSAKDAAEAEIKLGRYLDNGVTTFLDLTEAGEYHLRPYAAPVQQMAAARSLVVSHQRLSIPDMGIPTLDFMTCILNTLDEALAQGETVYVHCFGGIGRTGTVVGCWLVRHGLTGEQALIKIAEWRRDTPDGYRQSPETEKQHHLLLTWQG